MALCSLPFLCLFLLFLSRVRLFFVVCLIVVVVVVVVIFIFDDKTDTE